MKSCILRPFHCFRSCFFPIAKHRVYCLCRNCCTEQATNREKAKKIKSNKIYRQFQSNIFMYFITSSVADRYSVIYGVIASKLFLYNWKSFFPRGNEHLQNVVSVYGVKRICFVYSMFLLALQFTVGDIVIRAKLHFIGSNFCDEKWRKTCKQPIDKHLY